MPRKREYCKFTVDYKMLSNFDLILDRRMKRLSRCFNLFQVTVCIYRINFISAGCSHLLSLRMPPILKAQNRDLVGGLERAHLYFAHMGNQHKVMGRVSGKRKFSLFRI